MPRATPPYLRRTQKQSLRPEPFASAALLTVVTKHLTYGASIMTPFTSPKSALCSAFLGVLFVVGLTMAPAHAQATRTWVSGVGNDANPCSRTAPCKTWAGAISKTAPGGEMDALDPGGFGGVTITKAITIDGTPFTAGTLVVGSNGITISAGATDIVTLRGLTINGSNVIGTTKGILLNTGGALIVENCEIYGFGQRGISIQPTNDNAHVIISNTTIRASLSNGIV